MEPNEVADTFRRAAAGDQVAWNALVDSFSRLLWSIATSHRLGPADSADVVQTTWQRLVENLDRISQPERLGGWLSTTAARECLRLLRLRGREVVTDDEAELDRSSSREITAAAATPETIAMDGDRDARLWQAYALLPQQCQTLLHLLLVLTLPYAQIAVTLDMPVGGIGPTRARCLDRLRRLLAADGTTDASGG